MIEVIKVEDCGEKIGDYDIPIHNAIIIPNNATNGDVIKAMFPDAEFKLVYNTVLSTIDCGIWFSLDWWNAPYKPESERKEW